MCICYDEPLFIRKDAMSNKSVYDIIKRQNGENFAQVVRKFDSSLFEIENLPFILKYAGRYPEPLLDFLSMLKNVTIKEVENPKNPFDLLSKAGYKAYLVDTHQKQNEILKYFAKGEALCTFEDNTRYQQYFLIYCIKEGAENLKRSDFKVPKREDEYATSVISIQILKRGGFIKITNRYNHTVDYPDNTFNSNPDNIIEGLSAALKNHFKVDFSASQVPLPEGYIYLNGQIVEYDYERDNIYFSNTYFVENGKIIKINKDYQLIADRFILDLKEKKILNPLDEHDSFPMVVNAELQTKKSLLVERKDKHTWCLWGDQVVLMEVTDNLIKKINLPDTKIIPSCFMSYDTKLERIYAPNVRVMGKNSLRKAPKLESFSMKSLELMGERCVCSSELKKLFMPKIEKIGDQCFTLYYMRNPGKMKSLFFAQLKEIGWGCFSGYKIEELYLPSCQKIGGSFGSSYSGFKKVYVPELVEFPKNSLLNETVETLYAPKIIPQSKSSIFKKLLYQDGVQNIRE